MQWCFHILKRDYKQKCRVIHDRMWEYFDRWENKDPIKHGLIHGKAKNDAKFKQCEKVRKKFQLYHLGVQCARFIARFPNVTIFVRKRMGQTAEATHAWGVILG